MHTTTLKFGSLLIAVGLLAYGYASLSGPASFTALIPSILGFILFVCGLIGRAETRRRAASYAAAGIAVLGFLGSVGGLFKLPALVTGGEVARPLAVVAQSVTAVVLAVFLVLAFQYLFGSRRLSGHSV